MKYYREKKRFRLIWIAIALFSFVTSIIIVEMILGLMSENKDGASVIRSIRLKEHKPSYSTIVRPSDDYICKTDSLEQKNYRFETDDNGYIFPSFSHKRPDITLLFLGGSTTECLYVNEQNRFPYLVGRLLESNSQKVNSVNSGVSGNHSLHSINILLNKGLSLKPDIAIMMHNINDLNILIFEKDYWNTNGTRSLLTNFNLQPDLHETIKNFFKNIIPNIYKRVSIIKALLLNKFSSKNDEFSHLRGKELYIDKTKIIESFTRNLQAFINLANAYEITPVLMTQANRIIKEPDAIIKENWTLKNDFKIAYADYREIYLEMNQAIRNIGTRNNVLVIDLEKEVPQTSSYMYDIVHFNVVGSKYASKLISDQLELLIGDLSSVSK